MKKVLGIVAEYNPFHNGHLYHLIKAKQASNAEYTVAVISGNFTQRGDASIIDKWSKAESAILNGIDLVIELPVIYSVSSAENFAEGAIKILDSLGIVDNIAFGTETTNLYALDKFADVLYKEPKEYKAILSHELQKGISYPKARENALMMYLNDIRRYANILSSPNNILGIEYLKALKKLNSNIEPISIKRYKSGYRDIEFNGNIASATAIRNEIEKENIEPISMVLPTSSYSILEERVKTGHFIKNLSIYNREIIYLLRRMKVEEIAEYPDVSEGLEFALKNAANSSNTTEELINIVTSKRYTKTRIQRILVYILLDITKKDMLLSKKIMPYIRVLGFNSKGKKMLSEIAKLNPNLPIVTSVKKFMDENKNKNLEQIMLKDIWATNVYTLGYKDDSWANLDYTQKIIKIEDE